jgi:hypothetical protein
MIIRPKLQAQLGILLAISLLASFWAMPIKSSAQDTTGYPKLANYFISWDVTDAQAVELAKWDLVILAPQAVERNPDLVEIIRKNNPNIKILVYSLTVDINHTVINASPLFQRLYSKINDNNWWLYNTSGEHMSDWPNSWMINPARNAPRTNGGNWSDFLPTSVYNEFLKDNKYDGVFYDNIWPSPSWLNQSVDLDGNSQVDTPAERDANWQAGLTYILNETRRLAPNKIIIANNTSNFYNSNLNGRMIEMFPNNNEGGWTGNMKDYLNNGLGYQPEYFIVNGGTKNTGAKDDYANLRLGLTSALMGNGYFSFDYGDQNHGDLWWYDEYDVFLGKSVSADKNLLAPNSGDTTAGLWQREFQNGIILVNSTNSSQKVGLPNELEKIKGAQDKATNNGAIVKNVSLNPNDGLILLRRIENLKNSVYYNGSFVRVFNKKGETNRNGFFLYDKNYKGNSQIIKKDINKDGQEEIVVANTNKITAYNSANTELYSFFPYGDKYNLGINFDLNDFDNDGYFEIITGPGKGYAPLVKVFSYKGEVINKGFYAYAKTFMGGVTIAVCSTKGNANKEIITGTATSGSALVKIYDKNGKLLSGGINAYGKAFKGGVNIACGDIDGNGAEEIVTGAGFGGSSQVRIFNNKFQTINNGFWAYDKTSKNGVRVMVNDVDGNGIKEILAATPDVFTTAFAK